MKVYRDCEIVVSPPEAAQQLDFVLVPQHEAWSSETQSEPWQEFELQLVEIRRDSADPYDALTSPVKRS